MKDGDEVLVRIVGHDDARRYQGEGWEVRPMTSHHGYWSVLASRPIDVDDSGEAAE